LVEARSFLVVANDLIYADDGISGAEFLKRPGFIRLHAAEYVSRPQFKWGTTTSQGRVFWEGGKKVARVSWGNGLWYVQHEYVRVHGSMNHIHPQCLVCAFNPASER
jgi:hypothetical protein